MTPAPAAACAVHPLAPATFTCGRCGSFACEACRSTRQAGQCVACDVRGERVLDVGATLSAGLGLLRRRLPLVAACVGGQLLLGLVNLPLMLEVRERQQAGAQTPDAMFGGNFGAMVLSGLLSFAAFALVSAVLVRAFGDDAEGRARPLGETVRAGASRALPLLGLSLLQGLGIVGGFMLCVVPGVLLALAWSLAAPALMLDGRDVVAALSDSWSRTRGVRLRLLGVFLPALLAVMGASVVNLVLAPPLEAVGQGQVVAAFVLSQVLNLGAFAFLLALCTAAYVRLREDPRQPR
jgi:hypothetical protein